MRDDICNIVCDHITIRTFSTLGVLFQVFEYSTDALFL